jgi:adenylate cyclase
MANEIERKFLVRDNTWRSQDGGKRYRQGYLSIVKERTVRVRTTGDKGGFITIKGMSVGATRSEYEYEIPLADANEMLERLCERPLIEKTRYRVSHEGLLWEIDEFEGDNRGLIIAEVEFKDETQSVTLPGWIGQEVTGDPRYFNANLVANPFSQW